MPETCVEFQKSFWLINDVLFCTWIDKFNEDTLKAEYMFGIKFWSIFVGDYIFKNNKYRIYQCNSNEIPLHCQIFVNGQMFNLLVMELKHFHKTILVHKWIKCNSLWIYISASTVFVYL